MRKGGNECAIIVWCVVQNSQCGKRLIGILNSAIVALVFLDEGGGLASHLAAYAPQGVKRQHGFHKCATIPKTAIGILQGHYFCYNSLLLQLWQLFAKREQDAKIKAHLVFLARCLAFVHILSNPKDC